MIWVEAVIVWAVVSVVGCLLGGRFIDAGKGPERFEGE